MNTKELLRNMRVFNTHELLVKFAIPELRIAITYHTPHSARDVSCRKCLVWSPDFKTQSNGPWYNHGQKSFVGPKSSSLPEAKAWAFEQFKIKNWAPCPTDSRTWIPLRVRQQVLAHLKKHKAMLSNECGTSKTL